MGFKRARSALLMIPAAIAILLSGCGIRNNPAILVDSTITVTEVTESTVSITWVPAENEPRIGTGYEYEIYTSGSAINSALDLDRADLRLSGTVDELGEEISRATIIDLAQGSGYYVNIAAVHQRSGEAVLYDGVVAITLGAAVVSDTETGTTPYFHYPADTDTTSRAIDYSIDLGSTPQDVYLVFANAQGADVARPEVVPGSISDGSSVVWPATSQAPLASRSISSTTTTASGPVILRDRPEIRDWEPPTLASDPAVASRSVTPPPPSYDVENVSTATFYDEEDVAISATARKVRIEGSITLNIWVQDSEWDSGNITQAMVDFLADSFLSGTDSDDDIYEWLTTIYGEEWGSHPYGNLIGDNNEITILLWNIGNDGPGGVVGYFWAKDNFRRDSISYSNERVMFYLDSQSLGARSGLTWEGTDFWPQEMVATLAHEFQHMIHYYQRNVLLDADTPIWLNEMMSLVSEDLVSRNLWSIQGLDISGPRGVAPSTDLESGGAGSAGNQNGRLPLYNAYPSISLTRWLSGNDVLKSYSIAYSFGAFLSRLYGGAALMDAMMDSRASASETILHDAITSSGGSSGTTMDELLWKWGVSVLLSDDVTALDEVRMNIGGWFDSSDLGATSSYSLGSVNYFNYLQEGTSLSGPAVQPVPGYSLPELEARSVATYQLAEGATGTVSAGLLIPGGVSYTVVVK